MTGLVQAIDTPAMGWIPLPIETHSFAARPFAAPAAPADILEALRRAVGLASPVATVTEPEPAAAATGVARRFRPQYRE